MNNKTEKLTVLGIMAALAVMLHAIDSMIPAPVPVPGVKLGLANAVTLFVILIFDFKSAMTVTFLRVFLGSAIGGTFLSLTFLLSLSGGIASTFTMWLSKKYFSGLSIIGISIIGAVTHNLTQLIVASFVIGDAAIFYYLPFLMLAALPMGLLIGILVRLLNDRICRLLNFPFEKR